MPPLRSISLLALACLSTACGSSSFNSTWANTRAQPVDMTGKKVVAVVRVSEDARRRASEDALARELTSRGAQGIPSYTLFPGSSVDSVTARRVLSENQVAGLVIMTLTGVEKEVSSSPTYAGGYYGHPYYGSAYGGWGGAYSTSSIQTDTKVNIETRVYSLEQNVMVWAGTSETWNPARSDDVIRELAAAISKEMQRAKLIAPKTK